MSPKIQSNPEISGPSIIIFWFPFLGFRQLNGNIPLEDPKISVDTLVYQLCVDYGNEIKAPKRQAVAVVVCVGPSSECTRRTVGRQDS